MVLRAGKAPGRLAAGPTNPNHKPRGRPCHRRRATSRPGDLPAAPGHTSRSCPGHPSIPLNPPSITHPNHRYRLAGQTLRRRPSPADNHTGTAARAMGSSDCRGSTARLARSAKPRSHSRTSRCPVAAHGDRVVTRIRQARGRRRQGRLPRRTRHPLPGTPRQPVPAPNALHPPEPGPGHPEPADMATHPSTGQRSASRAYSA
jgi:hypothetical protein